METDKLQVYPAWPPSFAPHYLCCRYIDPSLAFKTLYNMELSLCLHRSPILMLQANLAVCAFLTLLQPLPHPCPHSRCFQKCPPPASPSVKTPSPRTAHFRPCIFRSLFPGTHKSMASLPPQSPVALGLSCYLAACFTPPYVAGISEICLILSPIRWAVWGWELWYILYAWHRVGL